MLASKRKTIQIFWRSLIYSYIYLKKRSTSEMTSFKQKVFKSQEGCCICKAKSSSSRFTSSKKYEDDCLICFKLSGDRRTGQICNACVLIVKRWRKLQPEELRDWSYVVDARALPGVRTLKSRRKKHQEKNKDPLKYKHRYKKKKIQSSNMDPVIGEPKTEGDFPTFLDESYWKR